MKLGEIAKLLGGEAKGDPEIDLQGAAGIHDVREGEITFLSDRKLVEECAGGKASCVVVREFVPELRKPQIIVKNPLFAFARLLALFYGKPAKPAGISSSAHVSVRAALGADVSVYPYAYIADGAVVGKNTVIFPGVFIGDDAIIGDDCIIYPHVTIREKVRIGNRVIVHAGSVIGSDGFGYVFEGGKHHKIPQVGGVVVGDDVEIGANVTVDRATTGDTIIGNGSKVDNLVQIAHNVRIGENAIIVAQVGIAGSSEIGNFAVLGGQVGIVDHTRIADGTMVGAQSGVMGVVAKGVYSGSPAMPHREWLKAVALFARLPELNKRVRELEEKIKLLQEVRDDRR